MFCLHVCLCEGVGVSDTGVADSCKLLCECWGLNLAPLDQPVLLTTKPSLQPLIYFYVYECFACMHICAPYACCIHGATLPTENTESFFFFETLNLTLCMSILSVYRSVHHMCGVPMEAIRRWQIPSLELELQMVVSYHVCAKKWTRVLCKSCQCS